MPRNEQAPAFQVYAADDLADAQQMTDDEFGKWNRLRALAWRDVGLPTDPARLAVILGVKPKEFAAVWAVVGAQFVERDGRYVLPWMERQRERQAERRERNVQNGRNGGRPPHNPPRNPRGTHSVSREEPEAKPNESPSSFKLQASGTASTSHPRGSAVEAADAAVRPRIPADYRPDLDALLARIPAADGASWLRGMGARLDGMHGAVVAPEALGEAIRAFTANGADLRWNLFAGYLRRAAAPELPPEVAPVGLALVSGAGAVVRPMRPGGRQSVGEETYANAMRGLDAAFGPETPNARGAR